MKEIQSFGKQRGSCWAWYMRSSPGSSSALSRPGLYFLPTFSKHKKSLLMNDLAPGSHRDVLFDLQKIFSFLPSQGLLLASASCLSYSWKSEKYKKIEGLIQRAQTGCAGIHTSIGHSTWKEEKDMRGSRPASDT